MPNKFSSASDPFSLSPLLALLPIRGNLSHLESLASSIFARHERVEKLLADEEDKENARKHSTEAAMLRQILEWLEVTRSGGE